eukprot:scaffold11665_cov60-Phaeocystis_antarctica.AAC.1
MRERRERRRERRRRSNVLRPPPAASMRPTPGTRAEMEAVKKFSRINVSMACICCSPAAFM